MSDLTNMKDGCKALNYFVAKYFKTRKKICLVNFSALKSPPKAEQAMTIALS
jgi:hypothetical protein